MTRGTLILGGGFGGLATAHALRDALGPDHPITLIDRRDHFYVGLRKLWVLVGSASLAEGRRPLARLAAHGIRYVQATIRAIDPTARTVETNLGTFTGDRMVVALGAEPRPDLVPGLSEHGFNLYDPASVEAAAERVAELSGGRVAVIVAGIPYKCPPAPYEAVLMLDARFRERGVRDAVQLVFTTLQPALLPNAGPDGARWLQERFARQSIEWHTGRKPIRFETGRVIFSGSPGEAASGTIDLAFDLAIVTPPHRAPRVVRESGLTGGGDWVRVDPATLTTSAPGVYAVGDVTEIPLANGTALPKAGLMAEAEGERVARAIAAELLGGPEPPPFDGRGRCFLETGGGRAALLEGDFYRQPAPAVQVVDESEENLRAKYAFERDRLDRWLG